MGPVSEYRVIKLLCRDAGGMPSSAGSFIMLLVCVVGCPSCVHFVNSMCALACSFLFILESGGFLSIPLCIVLFKCVSLSPCFISSDGLLYDRIGLR